MITVTFNHAEICSILRDAARARARQNQPSKSTRIHWHFSGNSETFPMLESVGIELDESPAETRDEYARRTRGNEALGIEEP